MGLRLPHQLAWLIDLRADKSARVIDLQKDVDIARGLIQELDRLRGDIEAIDRTLSLHKLKVDGSIIPPSRSRRRFTKLAYGELTKALFSCIDQNGPVGPYTTEIVEYVVAYHKANGLVPPDNGRLTKAVREMLRGLRERGLVDSRIDKNREFRWFRTTKLTEGYWRVPRKTKTSAKKTSKGRR